LVFVVLLLSDRAVTFIKTCDTIVGVSKSVSESMRKKSSARPIRRKDDLEVGVAASNLSVYEAQIHKRQV
jgi:hypothetical protein